MRYIIAAAVFAAAASGLASGAMIANGNYELHNHPDGSALPPAYGLRLDELYDATGGHDQFTFDFDHPMSDMNMIVTDTSITISGVAWGGLDAGGAYANDQYLGLYTIAFTYSTGVMPAPGDDDRIVDADGENSGSIITPLQDNISLVDKAAGGYSFRLGDEDNDNGHRGHDGISGWGWLTHGSGPHVSASDWLFTAEIPTPGSTALLALAGAAAIRRRRA